MAYEVRAHHTDAGLSVARCEGCGSGYEVDALGVAPLEELADCPECGSPVYVIEAVELVDLVDQLEECTDCMAAGDECPFHAGFAAGWDACASAVAFTVEVTRRGELAGLDPLPETRVDRGV